MTAPRTVDHWMTRTPSMLKPGDTLSRARETMRALGVRHLPIVERGELVGVLRDRDILLAERGHDLDRASCRQWCSDEPQTVDVDTSLSTAAAILAEGRVDDLVVLDEGQVVGIFTTTDACRALAAVAGGF
jgi:acetoin utilization protein AcuB